MHGSVLLEGRLTGNQPSSSHDELAAPQPKSQNRSEVALYRRRENNHQNGRDYYRLEGQLLAEPLEPWVKPSVQNLEYHAYNVFRWGFARDPLAEDKPCTIQQFEPPLS